MTALATFACRSCGAPIAMVRTRNGRDMPINAEPSDTGNLQLGSDTERHLTTVTVLSQKGADALRAQGAELFTSHFSTCDQPDKFRRFRRANG